MKIEDKLLESHDSLVEGITVLVLKTLYENKVIKPDEDVEPYLKKFSADIERWLQTEYVE